LKLKLDLIYDFFLIRRAYENECSNIIKKKLNWNVEMYMMMMIGCVCWVPNYRNLRGTIMFFFFFSFLVLITLLHLCQHFMM